MARIRTIKPSMWASEKLGTRSLLARINFIGLISLADDEGRGRAGCRYLAGQLHPYAENITEKDLQKSLDELQKHKFVAFYTVEEMHYYAIPGWTEHQRIDKPKLSEFPPVPHSHFMIRLFVQDDSTIDRRRVAVGMEGKGMEGNGDRKGLDVEGIGMENNRNGAPSAVDFSEYRLHVGKYKGVYVVNVPVDECAFLLANAPRLGSTERAALEWRIAQKKQEAVR